MSEHQTKGEGGKFVLITDDIHPYLATQLENSGYICHSFPDIDNQGVLEIIQDYTGLIVSTKIKVGETLIKKAEKLQFIGRAGSGMENIDVDYAKKNGVLWVNSPEGNRNAVAEHVLGMLLALFNKMITADGEMRNGIWRREENRGLELMGLTVGIIGFGNTGRSFANKLRGMDVKIMAYDKFLSPSEHPDLPLWSLKEVQKQADVISLHIPLNDTTRGMVNKKFINGFSKSFFLINAARGPVVKTEHLIQGLKEGKIRGACLDVFENEKPSTFTREQADIFQTLTKMDQVILTPHIAGWTVESKYRIAKVLFSKIK